MVTNDYQSVFAPIRRPVFFSVNVNANESFQVLMGNVWIRLDFQSELIYCFWNRSTWRSPYDPKSLKMSNRWYTKGLNVESFHVQGRTSV